MEHTAEINKVYELIKEIPLVKSSVDALRINHPHWYFGIVVGFQIVDVNTDTFKHFVDTNLTNDKGDKIPSKLSMREHLDGKAFCLSIGSRLTSQIHLHTPITNDLLLDFINRNLIKL